MKKRIIALMLIGVLCISCGATALASWSSVCGAMLPEDFPYCPYCGEAAVKIQTCTNCGGSFQSTNFIYCPYCGTPYGTTTSYDASTQQHFYQVVTGYTIDKLATRTGPATEYTPLGTYSLKNTFVEIISKATDSGGVTWLQCDIEYHGERRRIYTGLKRFDQSSFDLSQVPTESYLGYGEINGESAVLRLGPGYDYGVSSVKTEMIDVRIVSIEGDWVQIESIDISPSWRVWIEIDYLNFD